LRVLLVLFFLLTSFLGFGQSVSAPDSKSFIPSTNGQDASGFLLSGFSPTSTILASISLVEFPTGTTFVLNTTTGLTAASGFTLSGNKTRLVVTGTMANINTSLASLKVNTGSVIGNIRLSVAATVNPVGFFYNGVNGHFYKPISNGTTYTGARAASLLTTFKGQTGYLVTITSESENAFIFSNVPQQNIWFAATDEVRDGTWVIDAGPEKGTVMKTSNGQFTGNIPGVYNNWASGEPNGHNGSENYAVTNWNGQPTWNDLSNNWNNPYIIEYGTWTNPDDATFTEFYTNSVTHSNGDVLTARFNFDFGPNVDETKFSVKANTFVNNVWSTTTNTSRLISGLGKVDITNDLDTSKISNGGVRATTNTGGVEWCVIYDYDVTNQRYRVGIDSREVNGIISTPSTISSLQLFDLWNGPVTFNSYDPNGWTEVYIYTSTQFNFSSSSFSSFIRSGNGFYGLRAEFTFTPIKSFKQHGIDLSYTNQTDLNTLYNSVVTVSDVFLAFKELSNGGLFGNQSGNEFTSGIQFMNADVDGNGVFNEMDTYKLLQHLTGVQPLTQYSVLTNLIKLYSKSDYNVISKSNWMTQFNSTRSLFPFSLNTSTLNNTYNVNVTWVGDVNLSHSSQQSISGVVGNSIKTMSIGTINTSVTNEINSYIITEIVGDVIYAYVTLDPLQQNVVGTQFQINYDNSILKFENIEFKTKGNPINYGTNKGTYINVGSLITDGSTSLDKTTEYIVKFSKTSNITNVLGLISVGNTEAVNQDGQTLKIKIK
jgi:hypothetical protein